MYSGLLEHSITAKREAKPFMKWVGGKQQLLSQFEPYLPAKVSRYIEPFVGAGAVFFHLWNTNRLSGQSLLFDNNAELINTYCIIRDELESLTKLLATHEENHSKDYYYQIRSLDRQKANLTKAERAARILYLNKTCYNGLYRVNKKNEFNVPMGSYKNPKVLHLDVLRTANLALQMTQVEVKDFREIVKVAEAGDFIYFDPPYDPISKTSSFTGYTAGSFGDEDQQDLAKIFQQLSDKGCLCMLSNSYTPFICDLYKNFTIKAVHARRAINSDPLGRGDIIEAIVLNYSFHS